MGAYATVHRRPGRLTSGRRSPESAQAYRQRQTRRCAAHQASFDPPPWDRRIGARPRVHDIAFPRHPSGWHSYWRPPAPESRAAAPPAMTPLLALTVIACFSIGSFACWPVPSCTAPARLLGSPASRAGSVGCSRRFISVPRFLGFSPSPGGYCAIPSIAGSWALVRSQCAASADSARCVSLPSRPVRLGRSRLGARRGRFGGCLRRARAFMGCPGRVEALS